MTNPGSPYRPVTCTFYDELALFSMHQTVIKVEYQSDDLDIDTVIGKITDIYTLEKVEYCSFDTGHHIRLDRICAINDRPVEAYDE